MIVSVSHRGDDAHDGRDGDDVRLRHGGAHVPHGPHGHAHLHHPRGDDGDDARQSAFLLRVQDDCALLHLHLQLHHQSATNAWTLLPLPFDRPGRIRDQRDVRAHGSLNHDASLNSNLYR